VAIRLSLRSRAPDGMVTLTAQGLPPLRKLNRRRSSFAGAHSFGSFRLTLPLAFHAHWARQAPSPRMSLGRIAVGGVCPSDASPSCFVFVYTLLVVVQRFSE